MKKNGFSIVELLVVVAVISVLMAIAISNFPNIKFQLSLSRSAYKLEQDLRIAQQMSLAGDVYKDSNGVNRSIGGYGVYVDINSLGNKKYIIYADKTPGNKTYDSGDYMVSSIDLGTLEPGIIIKQVNNVSSNSASVNFTLLNFETTISDLAVGQNEVEFVLSVESDPLKTKRVFVNQAGLVGLK